MGLGQLFPIKNPLLSYLYLYYLCQINETSLDGTNGFYTMC